MELYQVSLTNIVFAEDPLSAVLRFCKVQGIIDMDFNFDVVRLNENSLQEVEKTISINPIEDEE